MKKALFLLVCFVLLAGCTKTMYVPVESTRTINRDNFIRDSIHILDSLFVQINADTVFHERFRVVYRDRILTDSVFRQDTIRVPYPVDKIVYRNKTSWYQDILIYCGLAGILVLLVWLMRQRK
ncbi:MAG: hypothetical protein LUH15_08485 [Tannerellaceae bacterium]|nr:hypothetical protein [Tannerellaceae bacterium]